MFTVLYVLFLTTTLLACLAQAVFVQGPSAIVDSGLVFGTTTILPSATATVNKFLGIPFAQSPPQRFAPPELPGKLRSPIDAKAWKPSCIQTFTCKSVQLPRIHAMTQAIQSQRMISWCPSLTLHL